MSKKRNRRGGGDIVQHNVVTTKIRDSGNTKIIEREKIRMEQDHSNIDNGTTATNAPDGTTVTNTGDGTTATDEPQSQLPSRPPPELSEPTRGCCTANDVSLRGGSQLSDSSIDTHSDQDVFKNDGTAFKVKSVNIAKIGNGGNSRVSILKNVQGNVSTDEIIDN
jgi:hypothetical protein